MRLCVRCLTGFLMLSLVVAGCFQPGTGTPSACDITLTGDEPSSGVSVTLELAVSDAQFPTALAFAPDGRLFFTEKSTGKIRVVSTDGQLLDAPFADLPVNSANERGLLGIALHPDFDSNGFLYVFYTRSSTNGDTADPLQVLENRVVRFTASGDVADGDETVIFTSPISVLGIHNGGNIHFGPDGKLYVTLGEIGDSSNSQNLSVRPGRIVRINDDGSIPDDNPFGSDNVTYALGLRNSFDFTFDPVSKELFATENGTSIHDEINRLTAGSNGGWPIVEGCSDGDVNVSAGTYAQPLVQSDGVVVPTGIAFVPNERYGAASKNQLLVSEYKTGRIVRYTLCADRSIITAASTFALGIDGLTDLEFSPDGTLYACSITQGKILKLNPAP